MVFESEEAQTAFHLLPVQTQYDWILLDETLRLAGKEARISLTDECLEMRVWIDKKPQNLSPTAHFNSD